MLGKKSEEWMEGMEVREGKGRKIKGGRNRR